MTERPKILVTQKIPDAAYPLLEAIGDVERNDKENDIWPYEELLRRAPGHDYILSLLTDTIDAHFLETCAAASPRLKMVANMAVGYDNIDLNTATRLHIAASNTPGVLSDTAADLAFGLLLAVARRIPEADRYLRAGKFHGWGPLLFQGTDVSHATLGIIGAGRIGQQLARRAQGFEMTVIYHNEQRLSRDQEALNHLTYRTLDELLAQSDFVSIHVPYNPSTHHLISDRELRIMQSTAYLINTARGPIVDEKALIAALQQGTIAGAGLDVYEHEPTVEPELLAMENVVLLPHIASASFKTRASMATMACDNIVTHHYGQYSPNILNPEVLK